MRTVLPPEHSKAGKHDYNLDEAYDFFISSRDAMKLTDNTKRYYKYNLTRFLTYCRLVGVNNVIEITTRICNGFLVEMSARESLQGNRKQTSESYFDVVVENGKKLSSAYLHSYARVMRTFLIYLYEQEVIPKVPKFEMPKLAQKDLPYFTDEQLKLMIETIRTYRDIYMTYRNEILIMFSVDSGLRLEEIANLNWNNINIKKYQVEVIQGKGQKDRTIAIGRPMANELIKFKDATKKFIEKKGMEFTDSMPVFVSRYGVRINPRSIDSVYERLGKKLGLNISSHSFRRTCARNLVLLGKSLLDIQTQLGHVNIQQTEKYIQKLTPEIHTQRIHEGVGSAIDAVLIETRRKRRKYVRAPRKKNGEIAHEIRRWLVEFTRNEEETNEVVA